MPAPPLPREHGAYAQLAAPIVTSLAVAGVSGASATLAAACVLAFLAHESLLVTLGVRGPRAKREAGARAIGWLLVLLTTATACGLGAVVLAPPGLAVRLLWPVVPAVVVLAAAARGLEKRWPVEVLVACTFALVALPLCYAAGADDRAGWGLAAPFAVVFVASTIAVRGVLLHGRPTAAPADTLAARLGAALLATGGGVALAVAASRGLLPWTSAWAVVPGAGAALALAARPPQPRHLHAVGWTLGAVTTAAVLVLVFA